MIKDSQNDSSPKIDVDRKSITFVCTGNICRSPMAERLLIHALKAEDEPLKSLPVTSTGVYASNGLPASKNAIFALKKVGLNLADHESRPLTQAIIDQSMVIFTMTRTHIEILEERFDKITPHVYLMREFIPKAKEVETPDPYGGTISAYENCRDSMIEAIPSIIQFLKNQISK